MPKGWIRGPQGQMRPAHPGGAVVHTMRIGLGEVEEKVDKPPFSPARALRPGEEPPPVYGSGLPPPRRRS